MRFLDPHFEFRPNDLLLRPWGAPTSEWQEEPADASAVIPDAPTIKSAFLYAGGSFTLWLTAASTFSVLRSIYLLDGIPGLSRFFSENGLTPKQRRVGKEYDSVEPEQFLLGDRLEFYRLLKIQLEHLHAVRAESVLKTQKFAVARARARLAASLEQIKREAPRYLRIENSPRSIDGALRAGYGGFPPGADLSAVQSELVRLRGIDSQWDEATRKYQQKLAPKLVRALHGAWDVSEAEWESVEALLERDAELAKLKNAELEARERYLKAVADASVQYPVLWRMHAFSRPEDAGELIKEIHRVLGNAGRHPTTSSRNWLPIPASSGDSRH